MPSCRHVFVQSKFGLQLTNFLVKSIILYLNLLMDFHSFDQFFKKGSLILCQWCSGPGCTHRHGWGWRWRTWARAIITAWIFGTFIWRHRGIIINGHLWWRHRAIIIKRHLWWRQGKHWNRGHLWWRQGKHWNHTLEWGWRTRTPIFFALQPSHQCSIAVGGPSNILRKCTMVHSIAPDGVHLNLKLLLGDLCPVSMHSNNSATNVLKDFSSIRRLRRCWFCWFASRHVAHKFQRDDTGIVNGIMPAICIQNAAIQSYHKNNQSWHADMAQHVWFEITLCVKQIWVHEKQTKQTNMYKFFFSKLAWLSG